MEYETKILNLAIILIVSVKPDWSDPGILNHDSISKKSPKRQDKDLIKHVENLGNSFG